MCMGAAPAQANSQTKRLGNLIGQQYKQSGSFRTLSRYLALTVAAAPTPAPSRPHASPPPGRPASP